ncbi:MAG: sigma-70 family RNA polymerase sigma factor [Isosphaeraceae bacterium]
MDVRPPPPMQAEDPPAPGHPDTDITIGDVSTWPDEHGDALYRYARLRIGRRELAEDLVQETFLAAIQSRGRFRGSATVRTWLLSILRHKIVDHYRRAPGQGAKSGRDDDDDAAVSDPEAGAQADPVIGRFFDEAGHWRKAPASWRAPDRELEAREFRDVLDGCLRRLPGSLASAFILRELEEIEVAELCEVLGLSAGNLRIRLHRARLLLRECLERHGFGGESGRSSRRTP